MSTTHLYQRRPGEIKQDTAVQEAARFEKYTAALDIIAEAFPSHSLWFNLIRWSS